MPHQVNTELIAEKREGYALERKKGRRLPARYKKKHSMEVSGTRCARAKPDAGRARRARKKLVREWRRAWGWWLLRGACVYIYI
jgi:hypothetical protein